MGDLQVYQYVLIALVFVWSGFVRSGLGFGGAVLSLPFLLLIDNHPLVYLPIIAVHLLFFSSITVWQNYSKHRQQKLASVAHEGVAREDEGGTVDWPYIKKTMKVMIIPKLIGVLGLLTIPASVMTGIIFSIVSVYAVSYILNKPFKSQNAKLDNLFLIMGAYISGTSLIGAPLIISVYANHVAKEKLRDTLFVLWFILVMIKMAAFLYAGVDLQLIHHLWLLPAAAIGHVIGLRFHQRIVNGDPKVFYRVLGVTLLCVSALGIASLFLK